MEPFAKEITKKTIENMEFRLVEGIRSSDIAFLNTVLHNDLRCMIPNGQIITKAMDLASHEAGQMIVQELIPTIEDIQLIRDTAIAVVIYKTKGSMLGNPMEGTFRYVRIWKQFEDGLKVIAASCFKLL